MGFFNKRAGCRILPLLGTLGILIPDRSKTKERIKKGKLELRWLHVAKEWGRFQQNLCKLCRTPLCLITDVPKKTTIMDAYDNKHYHLCLS
jgi:hypothetical protein